MIIATHGIVASQIQSYVGLLDLYPSAAAAYSVRKLRGAYTGSAIRVRRSSDNTEQDIGFTALGALDTSSLTSFCGSGNGFVTTWYDQSGNARNATQSTAANQPQIVSSGNFINNISNLPCIKFDGSNDFMQSPAYSRNQPYSIFMVQKYNSTNGQYLVDFGVDVAMGYVKGTGLKNDIFFGAYLLSTIDVSTSISNIWYALGNSSSSELIVNNESKIISNSGTSSISQITIGARGSTTQGLANSFYSEFILYPSNQSTNQLSIRNNINSYYGIY